MTSHAGPERIRSSAARRPAGRTVYCPVDGTGRRPAAGHSPAAPPSREPIVHSSYCKIVFRLEILFRAVTRS